MNHLKYNNKIPASPVGSVILFYDLMQIQDARSPGCVYSINSNVHDILPALNDSIFIYVFNSKSRVAFRAKIMAYRLSGNNFRACVKLIEKLKIEILAYIRFASKGCVIAQARIVQIYDFKLYKSKKTIQSASNGQISQLCSRALEYLPDVQNSLERVAKISAESKVLGMFHQRQSIIVAKLDKSEMPKFFLLNYNLDLIKKKPTKANENFFTELLYQRFPLIREHVSDLNLSNEQLVLWFDRNIVALMHIKMSITQIQQKYVIPYNTTIFGFFADLLRYIKGQIRCLQCLSILADIKDINIFSGHENIQFAMPLTDSLHLSVMKVEEDTVINVTSPAVFSRHRRAWAWQVLICNHCISCLGMKLFDQNTQKNYYCLELSAIKIE